MANDKKDLSLSDLDLNLDIDMEIEKRKLKNDFFAKSEEAGSTLDFYNDEMSRREVERLIKSREIPEKVISDTKEPLSKTDSGVDYAYILNLLNESNKAEYARTAKDDTARISMRKTRLTRAYKTTRLALIVVVAIFILTAAFMANKLVTSNAKIAELEKEIESFADLSTEYDKLKIKSDGQEVLIARLESENENLTEDLGTALPSDNLEEEPTNTTETEPEQPANNEPTKYIVQNGDSYWKISLKFYNTGNYYKDIMEANNVKNEEGPYPGDEIIIPKK